MKECIIKCQDDLDKISDNFDGLIIITGNVSISKYWAHVEARGSAHVKARGSAHVIAWESAHVEARESAHVKARGLAHVIAWESARVIAWGSAHVEARESARVVAWGLARVVAWGSAHVVAWGSAHVEARGSAHVEAQGSARVEARGSARVEARELAHVIAWDSAHVEAGKWTIVHKHFLHDGTVEGKGIIIQIPKIETAEEWCEYRGIKIVDGVAILYKAVRDDYKSAYGFLYDPGSCPEAPDWDGGAKECGGGLHFCASIPECSLFDDEATRFLACPINISDMRNPKADDSYLNKIKAKRVCGPIIEVDIGGKII